MFWHGYALWNSQQHQVLLFVVCVPTEEAHFFVKNHQLQLFLLPFSMQSIHLRAQTATDQLFDTNLCFI